ncbi:Uncharacterised protein [Mycobacteroides abscessus subsp. abscessus]|nr:Uncharacterised protein [Mycobacteroides abscessus subsp. abscessus]
MLRSKLAPGPVEGHNGQCFVLSPQGSWTFYSAIVPATVNRWVTRVPMSLSWARDWPGWWRPVNWWIAAKESSSSNRKTPPI